MHSAVADPDLEIRGGGHLDPEIIGGGGSLKKMFSAPRASVWAKNEGAAPRAPPLDPPLLRPLTLPLSTSFVAMTMIRLFS